MYQQGARQPARHNIYCRGSCSLSFNTPAKHHQISRVKRPEISTDNQPSSSSPRHNFTIWVDHHLDQQLGALRRKSRCIHWDEQLGRINHPRSTNGKYCEILSHLTAGRVDTQQQEAQALLPPQGVSLFISIRIPRHHVAAAELASAAQPAASGRDSTNTEVAADGPQCSAPGRPNRTDGY